MPDTTKYREVSGMDVAETAVPWCSGTKAFATSSPRASPPSCSSPCRTIAKFLALLSVAVVVLFALLGVAVFHAGHHFAHKAAEAVVPLVTTDKPVDLPTVFLGDSEVEALKHRVHDFKRSLHCGKTPPGDLVMTEEEINALLCASDEHKCGHMYVTLTKNAASADFSFPAEDVPGGKGRYFVGTKTVNVTPNKHDSSFSVQGTAIAKGMDVWDDDFPLGDVTFHVDLRDNDLDVRLKSSEILGWKATDAFVHKFLEGKNLAEGMCKHKKAALEKIEGFDIEDGKIVIRVRGAEHQPEEETSGDQEEWEELALEIASEDQDESEGWDVAIKESKEEENRPPSGRKAFLRT